MHATRTRQLPASSPRRVLHFAALFLIVTSLVAGLLATTGSAQEATTLIAIGESNGDAERAELLEFFGNPPDAQIEIITVEDTVKAMQEIVPGIDISTAFSSAALTCLPLGDGLTVETRNINAVTPAIYAIALVTAGVGDATLKVAAPAAFPAGGLTALTGIFSAWDKVSCESSQTTEARRELALREIALAVDIAASTGQNISGPAGFFLIEVQRLVVSDNIRDRDGIAEIVSQQEAGLSITLNDELRTRVIDFMVELQKQNIDWSTFSDGWATTLEGNTIVMTGDGVAIRNAQASATAKAAEEMTQTAQAADDLTATARAEKRATQTAVAAEQTALAAQQTAEAAQQTAEAAQKTAEAEAALTQTAAAQPTATATSTPGPTDGSGAIVAKPAANQIEVELADGQRKVETIAGTAVITRDGEPSTYAKLAEGDTVTYKTDFGSGQIVELTATPKPDEGTPIAKLLLFLPVLLLIPLGMVLKGRSYGDPFVVKRVVRD